MLSSDASSMHGGNWPANGRATCHRDHAQPRTQPRNTRWPMSSATPPRNTATAAAAAAAAPDKSGTAPRPIRRAGVGAGRPAAFDSVVRPAQNGLANSKIGNPSRVHARQARQMQTTLNGTCNTASGWVGGAVGAPNAPLCVWNSGRGCERRLYLICPMPMLASRRLAGYRLL